MTTPPIQLALQITHRGMPDFIPAAQLLNIFSSLVLEQIKMSFGAKKSGAKTFMKSAAALTNDCSRTEQKCGLSGETAQDLKRSFNTTHRALN